MHLLLMGRRDWQINFFFFKFKRLISCESNKLDEMLRFSYKFEETKKDYSKKMITKLYIWCNNWVTVVLLREFDAVKFKNKLNKRARESHVLKWQTVKSKTHFILFNCYSRLSLVQSTTVILSSYKLVIDHYIVLLTACICTIFIRLISSQ